MATLLINGERREVSADPRMPLLWALRDGMRDPRVSASQACRPRRRQ